MKKISIGSAVALLFLIAGPLIPGSPDQSQPTKALEHAKQYSRLLIGSLRVTFESGSQG